jgi:hypothetical protein
MDRSVQGLGPILLLAVASAGLEQFSPLGHTPYSASLPGG